MNLDKYGELEREYGFVASYQPDKIHDMSKDIKDYLHFYLGCQISDASRDNFIVCDSLDPDFITYLYGSSRRKDFRLVIRPLSDITEEEDYQANHRLRLKANEYVNEAETTRYLLSHGFDLFNLIESGLAIDKTTLNQTNG